MIQIRRVIQQYHEGLRTYEDMLLGIAQILEIDHTYYEKTVEELYELIVDGFPRRRD